MDIRVKDGPDLPMIPSLLELQQSDEYRRGLSDGRSGRPTSSEAAFYVGAYERGTLLRRAAARQIAVVFGEAWRCPACDALYFGVSPGLCCLHNPPQSLEWGMVGTHGTPGLEDHGEFLTGRYLRQLCASGVHVLTDRGVLMNPQILSQ